MGQSEPIEFMHDGTGIVVRKNDGHPESLTWIEIGGRTFYLHGVLPGMTRGEVKSLAVAWLQDRPQHLTDRLSDAEISELRSDKKATGAHARRAFSLLDRHHPE